MLPRTVIVPLDGSTLAEVAIEPALALARGFGAELRLVRSTWERPPDAEERYLHRLAGELDVDRRSCLTLTGFPANTVTQLVGATDGALLCLSTRGHSGLGEVVLGSVARDILVRTSAPAVLVGPAYTGTRVSTGGAVLVHAFDDSPAARALEPTVLEWARRLRLEVRVVTVLHRDGEFLGNAPSGAVRRAGDELVERLRRADVKAEHVLLDGLDAARAITEDALACGAALVVAGSTGRGSSSAAARLARSVLGTTAERIVHHATMPVLVAGTDPGS